MVEPSLPAVPVKNQAFIMTQIVQTWMIYNQILNKSSQGIANSVFNASSTYCLAAT